MEQIKTARNQLPYKWTFDIKKEMGRKEIELLIHGKTNEYRVNTVDITPIHMQKKNRSILYITCKKLEVGQQSKC